MPTDVAFFGGSFNPPHRAHRQIVEFLSGLSQFDQVWVVPTYHHPFAKELASYEHRFNMCQLLCEGLSPQVCVHPIEGELKQSPSFTIDVILALKKKYPHHRFWLVLGSDCRKDLPHWKKYSLLKNEVSFFFLPRPGHEQSPFMAVSSSQVREQLKHKQTGNAFLTPLVERYIRDHHLYV